MLSAPLCTIPITIAPHPFSVSANPPISSTPKRPGAHRYPLPPADFREKLSLRARPFAPSRMRSYLETSEVVKNESFAD